jgi:hypothetical protein
LRRPQVSNLGGDRFENTGQVSSSVRIPEAQHGDPVIGQPLIAFAIGVFVAGLCVLAPVELDRETQRGAIEIQNEGAGWMLSSKIHAELSISQFLP